MEDVQEFRFRGELQAAIQIAEEAEVARIADELAVELLEIPDDFLRPVGRALVQHHHAIRPERLSGDGIERLPDEGFTVENRDGGDEPGFHWPPA